jgi:hypothetical protein
MLIAQPRTESLQAKPPDKNTLSAAPGELSDSPAFYPTKLRRKHYGCENVETLRVAHESWNKRDFAGVVKLVTAWTITYWRAMLKHWR